MKKFSAVIIAGSLVFSMGTGVMAKGPAKEPAANSNPIVQEDGRNTNGIGTAQITFAPISGYYGTSQVVSGEVVIDGARDDLANLYITVGGQSVDKMWAIPGKSKTYGFIATVALTSHDLTSVEVIAETKFHNGQKAGKVHSNNSSIVEVEVLPVVTKYAVNNQNFVWYEETGTYSLTFTVEKTLSNGEIEEEDVTLYGLNPGEIVNYTSDKLQDENYFGETVNILTIEVPAAPVVDAPSVVFEWTGDYVFVGDSQPYHAWVKIKGSNGTTEWVKHAAFNPYNPNFNQLIKTKVFEEYGDIEIEIEWDESKVLTVEQFNKIK
ncbi:hypothetical protein [Lysinibacillus endophyticus]|uniref:hypothetical protein n=1 Tax=Ureibacillus endophyticus TaxID=1978490 RepID=UPI0031364D23